MNRNLFSSLQYQGDAKKKPVLQRHYDTKSPRIHTIHYRPAMAPAGHLSEPSTSSSSSKSKKDSSSSSSKQKSASGGKGSKQSKRKATDELWTEGNPPDSVNPLHPFLVSRQVIYEEIKTNKYFKVKFLA